MALKYLELVDLWTLADNFVHFEYLLNFDSVMEGEDEQNYWLVHYYRNFEKSDSSCIRLKAHSTYNAASFFPKLVHIVTY